MKAIDKAEAKAKAEVEERKDLLRRGARRNRREPQRKWHHPYANFVQGMHIYYSYSSNHFL